MTPEQLKATILQYAIQGKLVEQRAEEGTGEELYQQIQAEKQRLIKEGKIKKDKPLPDVAESEIPFDIPESWKWVRLNDAVLSVADIDHKMPETVENNGYPYISPVNFTPTGIDYDNAKMIGKLDFEHLSQKCKPEKGDIVFPRYGTIGVVRMVDTERDFLVSYSCCTVKNMAELMHPQYVFYVLQSGMIKQEINRYINKTTQPNVGLQSIKQFLFPIPPLAEQKRIVAKIEELLPLVDRYAVAYEKLEQFNAKFPEDMKKSILQYAIQGKLVEQRAEEGTGEELYRQIQSEKQRLIKEGKIKKEKPLTEIAEDEIPFDIPESWKWVRFSEIMSTMSTGPFGSMLHKTDYIEKGIPLVNPANMVNGKIVPSDKMMISEATRRRLSSYILHAGMIVLGRRGEMGRCAVVTEKEDGWLCGTGSFFMEPSMSLYVYYVVSLFSSPYVKFYLGGESVGTTMSNLNHTILSKMPIPLPPLAEQRRIVAKLDEILPLCERLK